MSKGRTKLVFRFVLILLGLGLVLELVSRIAAEILWFQEVDYFSVLIKRWQTQLFLWIFTCGLSSLFLLGNLSIASKFAWRWLPKDEKDSRGIAYLPASKQPRQVEKRKNIPYSLSSIKTFERPLISNPSSPPLNLPLLLTLVVVSCLLIAVMVVYYSKVAYSVWQPNYNLPKITTALPSVFEFSSFPQLISRLYVYVSEYLWQSVIVVAIVALTLFFLSLKPLFWLKVIATFFSLVFSSIVASNWAVYLQFLQPTVFNYSDPQFENNISFYIFTFPVLEWFVFCLRGLFVYGFIASSLVYLLSGNSLSEGRFPGFSRLQMRHLSLLASAAMFALSLQHWLNRYNLLYSERGVSYGASYTDVNIQLPLEMVLCISAIAVASWLLIKGLMLERKKNKLVRRLTQKKLGIIIFLIYLSILIGGNLTAMIVQRFVVQPNELDKEKPYIERSIALTRRAFGLTDIEVEIFNPQGRLSASDIQRNDLTIDNIRLWDTRPILQTNRQLQQIRLYYKFPDADIDRYTFLTELPEEQPAENLLTAPFPEVEQNRQTEDNFVPVPTLEPPTPQTNRQQVIIAARELDYSEVPQQAQTWVNKHLVYTHGYGFTLSPVNQVSEGGLPFYYVKNIGTGRDPGALNTSSELIRNSIPIGNPRIYYGELTDNYVMTPTRALEFDFPSGDDNVYFTYDGTGGIKIGNLWRRLLFAEYLKDWQMLFTDNFTSETRLLFRRNINDRVRALAPFLRYDGDPYLVVTDADNRIPGGREHYLYWIIDAYTISDRYPYSDPEKNKFNYIRNSVKVVVDAYNGNINFYIAEPQDPIIQTWNKVFPELFQSLTAMPANLRSHIRYPQDLFSTQSEQLLTYHMIDPQVFYNREDQWQIPQEIYGTESQAIEPYYLIMKLPTATSEEFILLNPFTPTSRPNLIAWLAGRSDGEEYGKMLLYQFPKQELIYGPNQIEALINQDPVISQQISLWNREGSRAIQGNLLIIPIEESLLYVEPLYLEAARNSLPTLARVIVVYQNQIVMAETLEEALQAVFAPEENDSETIIRPVDELAPLVPEVPAEENDTQQLPPTELEQ